MFVDAPRGSELASVYDRLIGAAATENEGDINTRIAEVCHLLLPALVHAHDWNLLDAETIARGLALVGADSCDGANERPLRGRMRWRATKTGPSF